MKTQYLAVLAFITFLSGCKNENTSTSANGSGAINFTSLEPSETGISFSNDLKDTKELNIVEYLYYYNGAGVAVGDINNDGLDDIFVCGNQKANKLYINKGNMKFEDRSKEAGIIDDINWSTGATIIDINNDGLKDIYVCHVGLLSPKDKGHNRAYINQGNGVFIEKGKELGIAFRGLSTQACWLDYDQDGDLDMYLLNHNIHNVTSYGSTKIRQTKDEFAGDRFYENKLKEEGKFIDVTEMAEIYSSSLGYGLAVSASDVNNDGFMDIYVGNDFHENDYLYINNGNKTFTESIEKFIPYTSQFSMGVDIADVNNDGWNDIFTTDMMPYDENIAMKSGGEDSDQIKRIKSDFGFHAQNARNHFQLNNGDGSFIDIAYNTRTYATDWSWSVLMQDFNNDKYADIFISNGIVKRPNDLDYINYLNEIDNKNPDSVVDRTTKLIDKMPSQPMPNVLFKNIGDGNYSKIYDSFVGKPGFSTGAGYSDLDNDGDLDLITNNINAPVTIMRNESNNKKYIQIELANAENKTSVGSKVTVFMGGERISKELQPTRGFMSSSSHILHFGLGENKVIDSIIVVWPDQNVQVLTKTAINQKLVFKRDSSTKLQIANSIKNEFTISNLPLGHDDNQFIDENEEKLIPERISYEGPALLNEDMDGDGIYDLFVGGGRNAESRLYFGDGLGGYKRVDQSSFKSDAQYEDVAAALIDFDSDGDKDLYVVSGGSDFKELDKSLEDRVYLNNGKRNFKRIPISLPHTNGSCISVKDVDGDGFEDIFVGARSIPGFYGLSPYSFILKNLGGKGIDIMSKERYGMVTDSKIVDIDGDKDQDLIICGDWMNVKVLINDGKGKFTDESQKYGTDKMNGLWNTVEIFDINKDGKLDILAGNVGQNMKWTASLEKPVKMFVGDFDDNGIPEPLIFYHSFNRYLPTNSMDKLVSYIPFVKDKFQNYSNFSKVKDVKDIFEKYEEKLVETKVLTEFRSMVFLSNSGKYVAVPFDKNDQLAPIQDITAAKDGTIYYVANHKDFIGELGPSLGRGGAILGRLDPKTMLFDKSTRLPLNNSINSRHLSIDDRGQLAVAANQDRIYILSKK